MISPSLMSLKEQMNSTLSAKSSNVPKRSSEVNLHSDSSEVARFNLKLPQEMKTYFENLAKQKGLTFTKFILYALQNLQEEIDNGSIQISSLGIVKKI